jgi:hypothetical protein
MQGLALAVAVQLSLGIGLAGLFWPEKLKPVFEVLMFPFYPTFRVVRWHSIATLAISFLLFVSWITQLPH